MLFNLIQHLMVLTMILSRARSGAEEALALPGCLNKCGTIAIRFPFGTREGCYLNKLFLVDCENLLIWNTNFTLQEITHDGYMRGLLPMAHRCYNKHHEVTSSAEARINLSRFRVPSTLNVLTTVGCDARADIKIFKGESYITGCVSITNCHQLTNGSCLGMGCSQAMLPYSMKNFRIHADSNTGKVGKWGYNNCTYGFVVEKGQYTFNQMDFGTMQNRMFPVVLEWWVGDISCEKAKERNNGTLCQENSLCINIPHGVKNKHVGYRCQCAQGYKGNAYLPNGCKDAQRKLDKNRSKETADLDECEGDRNNCMYKCVNKNGSYTCSCPSGHVGDGWKNGTGCSVQQMANTLNVGRSSKIVYQGIGMGIAATVLFTIVVYQGLMQRKNMKQKELFFKKNGGLLLKQLLFESKKLTQTTKIFETRVLEKATDNFHKRNVIGQGGYGTVYKGTLKDKSTVAIKKSKSIDESQIEQFINEVIILSEISHPNVVKLLGCCLGTETPLLVYEFVTNKTVFNHLHDNKFISSLTFERRLNIAAQTAEALAYIHSTTQIIHRDIKSSNILLTDDYAAKVSDFGISKFFTIDQTHIQTLVHGTLGYIDPEYFRSGILTEKSDVYSFGMVLVELITGRKVFSRDGTESDMGLAMFFVSSLERGCLIQILDHQLKEHGFNEHIKYIAKLAKECVELEGKKRPSMDKVKEELEELRQSYMTGSSVFKKINCISTNHLLSFD